MNNKMIYKDNEWLKAKDLVPGLVYVVKDGRLLLYLGQATNADYCFYVIASAYLVFDKNSNITFGNYEWQVLGLTKICDLSISHPANKNCILQYKGIPKIHGIFNLVNYTARYKMWYISSFNDINVPNISNITHSNINLGYVRTKDLIPGNLYYTGGCWRSTYVYLGRTSSKKFVWFYIGNEETLLRAQASDLLMYAEVTKNNKKVKNLKDSLKDKNAYVCRETKRLIDMDYKVSMYNITQEMIDQLYN